MRRPKPRIVMASYLFGILVFSALVGMVARLGDLERFTDLVRRLALDWLALCALLQAGTYLCEGWAWKAALDRFGLRLPMGTLLPLSLAKLFSDQAMPSAGVSGNAFFIAALRRRGIVSTTALGCVFYEAAAYFAAYAFLATCSLLVLLGERDPRHWLLGATAAFAALEACIPLALWHVRRHGRLPAPGLGRHLPRLHEWTRLAQQAATGLPLGPGLFARMAALRAAIILLDAATLWTILRGLGQDTPPALVFSGFMTASMAMSLSPIPLGLGTFEATCVGMLHGAGVGVEAGLAATLLLRGMTTWLPMLPGLWLVRRELRDAPPPARMDEPPDMAARRADMGAADSVARVARLDADAALRLIDSDPNGLTDRDAAARLLRHGRNSVARERRRHPLRALLRQFARPLPLLLLGLALLNWATGQPISAIVIATMVALASLLGFVQEHRADLAFQRLRSLVRTTARVVRRAGGAAAGTAVDLPLDELVPGDIVLLGAGDLVPAEVRFLDATDLFVDQSALTGESLPVEKRAEPVPAAAPAAELANIGFMGTHVTSGSARALVIATGAATGFGQVAAALAAPRAPSDFDRGIDRVVRLLLRMMLAMAPLVLFLNAATKGDWHEALLFATSVAVGLAPEMLPMIVTINLARGALQLADRQVIVKRLGAVQTLGAIDVLCTDKTGTLTQDRVVLERHVDIDGNDSETVVDYAYLNSFHQTGLHNLLDTAVLQHAHVHARLDADRQYRKIGEVPFDFRRRRMSVVLARTDGARVLVCKGAVEEVTSVCGWAERSGERIAFDAERAGALGTVVQRMNAAGLRTIAIAYRLLDPGETALTDPALERGLVLVGYVAFLDPPKESAPAALAALARHGVAVKVLSGDNAAVCAHVCGLVGIDATAIMDGAGVAALDDAGLARAAARTNVFAKLTPDQKTRVIRCLQQQGHVTGFLGDGINDSPALKQADVGISVDTGADIARESADLILLQKSLVAVDDGVMAGRTVFGNIVKYIRMSASSNFGNMFSVLGASMLLPFLPMAPVQVLLNNFLYDCSQTALTTDRVDRDYLARPRRWDIGSILRYVLCFGPISSLFDYATFALLWFGLGARHAPALFQTGWFVESLLSQTLIVHVIRTSTLPSLANRPSTPLLAASLLVCGIGLWLPHSVLAGALGFVPLPAAYWWDLGAILLVYALLTQAAKSWLIRRFGIG